MSGPTESLMIPFEKAIFFNNSHGMNNMAELFSKKHKGYRKKWFTLYVFFKSLLYHKTLCK